MARDVREHGTIRPAAATLMWGAYAAHLGWHARALARSHHELPVPDAVARALGPAASTCGVALTVSGMSTFASVGEVGGTRNDALSTGGVYRYSRNPQYLGYLLVLGGTAIWRRSIAASLLTAAAAVIFDEWIPVEEEQLRRLYGQQYRDYAGRVNRWWGRSTARRGLACRPSSSTGASSNPRPATS